MVTSRRVGIPLPTFNACFPTRAALLLWRFIRRVRCGIINISGFALLAAGRKQCRMLIAENWNNCASQKKVVVPCGAGAAVVQKETKPSKTAGQEAREEKETEGASHKTPIADPRAVPAFAVEQLKTVHSSRCRRPSP